MGKKRKGNKKDIAVIGTGRFGTAVVEELIKFGRKVIAIDVNEDKLTPIARLIDDVIIADGADLEGLKAHSIDTFDTVIVGVSNNIEIVAALLELGVKHIIAKATSRRHERVLKQIGVDVIVRPEAEAGSRTALIATQSNFIKYSEDLFEIGDGYAIGSTSVHEETYLNKPLKDLKLTKLKISVVSIEHNGKVKLPTGMTIINDGDIITLVGKVINITNAFGKLNSSNETAQLDIKEMEIKKNAIRGTQKR
ncbi:MAG: TrkA family potassium uptake protein [Mollicutes bacterium PWAP]|nr:TrkA family potassium uptake protein [Mollicutes bacterium PWAP]